VKRILDLCCGGGGASKGYADAGYRPVGVDHAPQPDYPYEFLNLDALQVLRVLISGSTVHGYRLSDFSAIHASFPCQNWTAYRRKGGKVGEGYPDLITPGRPLLEATDLPYIMENVPGSPLRPDVQLCGSSFGLDVRRHRIFESNVTLVGKPCDHSWQTPRFTPASNRKNLRRTVEIGVWRIPLPVQQKAMGIDWLPLRSLSESIPPAYTEYLGRQLCYT
jgi:DNA (cytosine-5)-methyltransferase 1